MAYKVFVSPRAQSEIESAIDYYSAYSLDAAKSFISLLAVCYRLLEINPFFNVRYKKIRSLKISKFPYSLYFIINEKQKYVRVLSCFHNKRNPESRPKR